MKLFIILLIMLLPSCAFYKFNEQTKPEFYVPKSEHYPTGKAMKEWIAEMIAKDAKEKTKFEKLK